MSVPEPGRKTSRNRHSLFARNSFSAYSLLNDDGKNREPTSLLTKRRTLSSLGSLTSPTNSFRHVLTNGDHSNLSHCTSSNTTRSMKRSASLLGSKKFTRYLKDDFEDAYAAASSSPAPLSLKSRTEDELNPRNVICHGEVQISSFKFRKKRDYLVLTDLCIIRFKTLQRATETFPWYCQITKIKILLQISDYLYSVGYCRHPQNQIQSPPITR